MSSSARPFTALCCLLSLCWAASAAAQVPTALPLGQQPPSGALAEVRGYQAAQTARQAAEQIGLSSAQGAAERELARVVSASRAVMGVPDEGAAPAPSYREILAMYAAPEGALSIGTTSEGRLTGSATLAVRGPHHQIIARSVPRDVRYGTPAIVALIEGAAADVAAHHEGSVLAVGNIARAAGGDIPWSKSHNSGRDADLVFYTKERAGGRQVITPDLFSFEDDGTNKTEPGLVFDVARNWALARALITSPHAQVQYLFISEALKAQLLAHAQTVGEPEWLIERASRVLHQPTDALPHDDHFHLRIYCPREDRLLGCMESGPRWGWVDHHDAALFAWTRRMVEALGDRDVKVRQAAIAYLVGVRAPHAAEALLWVGAHDADAGVRAAALDGAAGAWPWSGSALAGAEALIRRAERTPDERRAAYNILRRSHDPSVIPFLLARLEDEGLEVSERVWAARGLEHLMLPGLVPELIARLTTQPAAVRAELARVLRRIANRDDATNWSDDAQAASGQQTWQRWWEGAQQTPREVWVMQGLADAGIVRGETVTVDHVDVLITRMAGVPDHVLYNLNKTLRDVTGLWAPLDQKNAKKLQTYWKELWKKRRERVLSRG
jgi:murein endopeptidase